MRSFNSLPLRQLRTRRLRALLTMLGIVLGVGMICGVLLLSATIRSTFSDLFDSIYGKTDLVVSGKQSTGSLKPDALRKVRSTDGVGRASGTILDVFSLLDEQGRPRKQAKAELNVTGTNPRDPDLTDSQLAEGREAKRGAEIELQETWAKSHRIEVGDRIRLATPEGKTRLRVVGLFNFSTGLNFGGEGFATMPIAKARQLMDKERPPVYDEIQVVAEGSGNAAVERAKRRLRKKLGRGVEVSTPESRSEDIEDQIQSLDVILFFFAGMALFVGGFLIFNAFNMTVLQRMREIGMLRTLGATRAMITRSVLLEAVLLGVGGVVLGLGAGVLIAKGLVRFLQEIGFPVGDVVYTPVAAVAAVLTGLLTTVLGVLVPARRAGRITPIRAVLGTGEVRERPRPRRLPLGFALIGLGGAGCFWLASADDPTALTVAAGISGVFGLFLGIATIAPFGILPLVRALSWPLRKLFPVEGRLAADSAGSNPKRTAATATALTIGLALVVAFGTLGSSFLGSISDEFDRNFARDFSIQPRGFAPGQGPQPTIARSLRDEVARIPEARAVARERFVYVPELPRKRGAPKSEGLLVGFVPREYRRVDATEFEGARSRADVFRRLDRGEVTVGKGYAEESGIRVGDRLKLDGPSGRRTARVAGIVDTVAFAGDTVGMSIKTMRRVYGTNADTSLALTADSARVRPLLERKLERLVERDHPNLVVLSNEELKSEIADQVNQQFGVFNAILGVAIVVSLFGIINTLTMSVIERTREIGVLRALGSSRWQVRRSIVDESLVIALIGAVIGLAVGAVLGWVILEGLAGSIPSAEYRPPLTAIATVSVAAVVLGLVASILPARRAARLNVIEALSYE